MSSADLVEVVLSLKVGGNLSATVAAFGTVALPLLADRNVVEAGGRFV